jgi:diacylglycerol kinase
MITNKKKKGNSNIIESVAVALEGLYNLLRTEGSIQYITATNIIFHILAYKLTFSNWEWTFGAFLWINVLILEVNNTALENDIDYSSNNEYHPLIKKAKDYAAASVFLGSSFAIIVSWIFIIRHFPENLNFL